MTSKMILHCATKDTSLDGSDLPAMFLRPTRFGNGRSPSPWKCRNGLAAVWTVVKRASRPSIALSRFLVETSPERLERAWDLERGAETRQSKLSTELLAKAVEFEDARPRKTPPPSEEQALAAIARALSRLMTDNRFKGPPKVVGYLSRETIIALSSP
jgi:hypothetical protein